MDELTDAWTSCHHSQQLQKITKLKLLMTSWGSYEYQITWISTGSCFSSNADHLAFWATMLERSLHTARGWSHPNQRKALVWRRTGTLVEHAKATRFHSEICPVSARSLTTSFDGRTHPRNHKKLLTATTTIGRWQSDRPFSSSISLAEENKNYLHSKYQQLVESGQLSQDSHQLHAINALERLRNDLFSPSSSFINNHTTVSPAAVAVASTNSSSWSWWNHDTPAPTTTSTVSSFFSSSNSPRGVYLHGGVGCGKSFLMHLFHDSLSKSSANHPISVTKQFVHYHKFMLDIHRELHVAKTKKHLQGEEAVAHVVNNILQAGRVLCCDEFQVTDVADAMLLVRLLPLLWQSGCVLVATSNRAPQDLYAQGLQRDLFVPLIHQLTQRCQVVSMEASETDYRVLIQQKQQQQQASLSPHATTTASSSPSSSPTTIEDMLQQSYFVGKANRKKFHSLFYQVTQGASVAPMSLYVSSTPSSSSTDVADGTTTVTMARGARKVNIPWACPSRYICRFAFEDLCAKALGAADYMVLASHFSMIFVEQIPTLTVTEINWLRRFITFCDTMYDAHVVLVLQAAVPLDQLLQIPSDQLQQLRRAHDEVFAFDRTKSRLQEMTSITYIQETHSKWIPPPPNDTETATVDDMLKQQPSVRPRTTIAFQELRVEPSLADDASR
jgi:predicted ATPase